MAIVDKKGQRKEIWTKEQILELWPQAEGELRGFERGLKTKSAITAFQLDMALQLADKEYQRLRNEREKE
ncbi:MAG: hypothetical protein AAB652_00820 [Patescibacteria group bacterium]